MSATMTQALAAVREALDEATAAQWTDTELRRWINEGLRDIARRTRCLPKRADVVAVAGTQEYSMPNDAIAIHRMEFRETGSDQVWPLEYRDWNTMDEVWWTHQGITQSRPYYWTQWGFPTAGTSSLKFVVYPIPAVGGTFKVFYFKVPAQIATDGTQDAQTLEVPEGWEDAAFAYAEYRALRKDRDPRWQEALSRYEQVLGDLHDTALRYSDQVGQIVGGANGVAFIPDWLWRG